MNEPRFKRFGLPHARKENGRWICRGCQQPITAPRRTSWCSDACLEDNVVRLGPGWARSRTHKRDHGVCALCGLDTDALAKEVSNWDWRYHDIPESQRLAFLAEARQHFAPWIVKGFPIEIVPWGIQAKALWECDHIVAVVEGGGSCALSNLRTLCVVCHRAETAKLRKRLARQRRRQLSLLEKE